MNKLFFQLLLLLALFFGTWMALSRVNFMKIFKVEEKINVNEKKFGDIIWETIEKSETVVKDQQLNDTLQYFKKLICEANNIPADSIRLHIIEKDDVNAFALPNNRLIIHTGLIQKCANAEELCSVMAHEIAHIRKNHVMKKMLKEAGIAIISAVTGGSGSSEVIRQLIKMLSSSAYDRTLEAEADETGAGYLCKTGIDPEHMANFFMRISNETELPELLDWVSTHPDSKERAAEILKWRKKNKCAKSFQFNAGRWKMVQMMAE